MKIIGHRGAAGLAPENTIKAIEAGIKAGADAVEFDIRLTKDGVFVLCHDASLLRAAGSANRIGDMSLKELRTIDPFSGEAIPTLDEALAARGKATAVIEPKSGNWAKPLVMALKKHLPSLHVVVIAFNHPQLIAFHELLPDVPCYALERHNPFRTMQLASETGLSGVNLNFWLLNPFTYAYARMKKLDIVIYTVDRPLLMRYFRYFYPKVAITTNRPDILKKIKK